MAKRPPVHATGSINLTTPQPITRDSLLQFSWNIEGLSGREYPMVIVRVEAEDGCVLYGRLDHPEPLTPWVISAGSSPWHDPDGEHYGKDGVGVIQLWVYVPFRSQTADNVYMVATTPEFPVVWS